MSQDVNDYLLSSGIPAAKFPAVGATVKGTVVASEVMQQTDYATNQPKFYEDGKPMQQVVITLQTADRDPDIDGDEGLRKLYVRGQMTAAVRDALRAAGAKLERDGILAVRYIGDKPSEKRGFNPAKQYQAQYQPPSAGAANDLLAADSQPAVGVPAESLID